MPKSTWTRLFLADDLQRGRARFVTIGDHELAVFRLPDPDRFIITRNSCPHAGGNLAAGEVRGGTVTCPWHHWEFDLDSGACTLSESVRLHRFESKIEEGWLWVSLST